MRRSISLSPKLRTRKKFVAPPRQIFKVGRNDPCPCGSGKKYKDCHASQGEGYLIKLAKQKEKERIQKKREKLKEQGVPWWKRWIYR